jgi:membrane-associated protease RseP (regulator of RpoE activity)
VQIDYGWVAVGVVILAYVVGVLVLYKTGRIARDHAISFFGPCLMIKTERGRDTLDRVAKKAVRFWNWFGDAGIVLALVAMAGMALLLLWEAVKVLSIPASAAPSPAEALALPGINPFIPVGYGIVALVVAVVLHELCHGVLARANDVKVKSLGILWLVIPIGAFVEQDEDEMMKAPARKRDRIAAAGVMANFVLAIVFLLILSAMFSTSIQPKADGIGVYGVLAGSPAQNASIATGDIITMVNGSATPNIVTLRDALAKCYPGENVTVEVYSQSAGAIVPKFVVMAPASAFESGLTGNASRAAFMGIQEYALPPQATVSILQDPVGNGASQAGISVAGGLATPILFLALPFVGMEPVQGTAMQFFTISGPLAALGTGGVWVLINMVYWLAWMNLLLGLCNALPAVPLDGGFLFTDALSKVVRKFRSSWSEAKLESVVNRLSIATTLFIFFLIIWQFVGPRL